MKPSRCIGKEVATKYFLPRDLKLNLFWLGFPNYLYWCVDYFWCLVFCSEFIESKQKKGRRKISRSVKIGTLAWQLNVRLNKLAAKTRHHNQSAHQFISSLETPNRKRFNFKSPGRKYFVATSLPIHFDAWNLFQVTSDGATSLGRNRPLRGYPKNGSIFNLILGEMANSCAKRNEYTFFNLFLGKYFFH